MSYRSSLPRRRNIEGTHQYKFNPSVGRDSVLIQNCNVKCHSISLMAEYCSKSFEELRWEDYQFDQKQKHLFQNPLTAFQSAPSFFTNNTVSDYRLSNQLTDMAKINSISSMDDGVSITKSDTPDFDGVIHTIQIKFKCKHHTKGRQPSLFGQVQGGASTASCGNCTCSDNLTVSKSNIINENGLTHSINVKFDCKTHDMAGTLDGSKTQKPFANFNLPPQFTTTFNKSYTPDLHKSNKPNPPTFGGQMTKKPPVACDNEGQIQSKCSMDDSEARLVLENASPLLFHIETIFQQQDDASEPNRNRTDEVSDNSDQSTQLT